MSVWKLTDNIWWGDANSPRECLETAESVICVAENAELSQAHFSPYHQHLASYPNRPKPFFWLPINDHSEVYRDYLSILRSVIETIDNAKLYPLLIHCYAGVHRSPAVAIYAGTITGCGTREALHTKALQLRPEMEYHAFSKSLHRYMGGEVR